MRPDRNRTIYAPEDKRMSSNDRKDFFNIDRLQWITDPKVSGSRALILIVVGIILILFPYAFIQTLIRIIGAGALLFGLFLGVSWYKARSPENGSMLAVGVIALLIGLYLVTSPGTVANFFPIAAGVVILLNGAAHLGGALDLRKSGSAKWVAAAIMSGITILVGLYLLSHPAMVVKTVIRVVGIALVYNGLTGYFIAKQMN